MLFQELRGTPTSLPSELPDDLWQMDVSPGYMLMSWLLSLVKSTTSSLWGHWLIAKFRSTCISLTAPHILTQTPAVEITYSLAYFHLQFLGSKINDTISSWNSTSD